MQIGSFAGGISEGLRNGLQLYKDVQEERDKEARKQAMIDAANENKIETGTEEMAGPAVPNADGSAGAAPTRQTYKVGTESYGDMQAAQLASQKGALRSMIAAYNRLGMPEEAMKLDMQGKQMDALDQQAKMTNYQLEKERYMADARTQLENQLKKANMTPEEYLKDAFDNNRGEYGGDMSHLKVNYHKHDKGVTAWLTDADGNSVGTAQDFNPEQIRDEATKHYMSVTDPGAYAKMKQADAHFAEDIGLRRTMHGDNLQLGKDQLQETVRGHNLSNATTLRGQNLQYSLGMAKVASDAEYHKLLRDNVTASKEAAREEQHRLAGERDAASLEKYVSEHAITFNQKDGKGEHDPLKGREFAQYLSSQDNVIPFKTPDGKVVQVPLAKAWGIPELRGDAQRFVDHAAGGFLIHKAREAKAGKTLPYGGGAPVSIDNSTGVGEAFGHNLGLGEAAWNHMPFTDKRVIRFGNGDVVDYSNLVDSPYGEVVKDYLKASGIDPDAEQKKQPGAKRNASLRDAAYGVDANQFE